MTGIIVARSLGPVGRGAVAAVSLWPIVFASLFTFGIPLAVRYQLSRVRHEDRANLLATALLLSASTGVISILIGIVVLPVVLHNYPGKLIQFAMLMMLFAPQIMCNNTLQAYLEASGAFASANKIQYVPPLATLLALVILYQTHALSTYSAPLAYFCPTAFVTVFTLFRLRQSIQLPPSFTKSAGLLLSYGLRAYGLNVISALSGQLDQAIIVGFLSAASFGLYGVALNIAAMLGIFAASVNIVLFPKASRLEAGAAINTVEKSARLIFATTTLAGLCALLLIPVVVLTLYGNAFGPVIHLTRILVFEVVLTATSTTFAQAFMATGRPGLVSFVQGTGVCVAFPLMLILIPRFGLTGAAYALLIAAFVRLACTLAAYPLILERALPRLVISSREIRELASRVHLATQH